jgi:hypothetical protein
MTEATPLWQRALPFLALVPAAAAFRLGNAGSLGSLAIVGLALAFVKGSRRPTFAFVCGSWWVDILIGVGAALVLAIAFDHLIDP